MSEFHVRVVEIGAVEKHPNADSLSVTTIGGAGGYPCILRTGEFKPGDKAVYVPADDPRWAFLGEHREIEAKRLRGIFSMGVLTAADPSWEVGRDVAFELRITRAEAPEPTVGNERDPGLMPTYTDIAGLRAHPSLFVDGEEVVVTEKIHGETMRAVYAEGRLWVGSRTAWKSPDGGPVGGVEGAELRQHHWWDTARRLGLEERLQRVPGIGVCGEIFGDVPGMKYGATSDRRDLRIFDAVSIQRRAYLDFDEFIDVATRLDLPMAPVLYRGPWRHDLREMAEGSSSFAAHVREGIVIKPVHERFDPAVGRVILKLHGSGFLLGAWKKKAKRGVGDGFMG